MRAPPLLWLACVFVRCIWAPLLSARLVERESEEERQKGKTMNIKLSLAMPPRALSTRFRLPPPPRPCRIAKKGGGNKQTACPNQPEAYLPPTQSRFESSIRETNNNEQSDVKLVKETIHVKTPHPESHAPQPS